MNEPLPQHRVPGKGRPKGDKSRGKGKGPRAYPRPDESDEEEDPWSRYTPSKGASSKGKERPKGRDPWLDRSGWESGWGYPYPEAYPARSKGGYYEERPEPCPVGPRTEWVPHVGSDIVFQRASVDARAPCGSILQATPP